MRVFIMLGLAALLSSPVDMAGATERTGPSVLEEQIAAGVKGQNKFLLEAFLTTDLFMVRAADRDGDGLDAADIKFATAAQEAQRKASRASLFYSRDVDADGKVTRDEFDGIPNAIVRINPRLGLFQANAFANYDLNHDEVLTLDEMLNAPDIPPLGALGMLMPRKDILPRLMELDANNDGKLTIPELASLMISVFARFDKNGDGSIDDQEARDVPK